MKPVGFLPTPDRREDFTCAMRKFHTRSVFHTPQAYFTIGVFRNDKLQFHFAQTVPCNKKTTSFQRSFLLLCFFVAPSVSRVLCAPRGERDDHLSARPVTKALHSSRCAPPSKWIGSGRPALRPYTVLHRIEFTANPRYRGSG